MSTAVPRPIDELRRLATRQLDPVRRAAFGQFMTPSGIADFMASLFQNWPPEVRLLDPGAGVGSLSEAFVRQFTQRASFGARLSITAYEVEPALADFLSENLSRLEVHTRERGQVLEHDVLGRDFVIEGSFAVSLGAPRYTHVILNPPYKKIGASTHYRLLLRKVGVETVNLYTAFLALSILRTEKGGEIIAIVPRSFCNGTYFRPFRRWLLDHVAVTHLHVFESRKKAFQDDDVLQENIIIRLVRDAPQGSVSVSSSDDATFNGLTQRIVPFEEVVKPGDEERFIHVPVLQGNSPARLFAHTLSELGLDVATGPVVDFRLRDHWLTMPTATSAPLLYAHHFRGGEFGWPKEHKKPNALTITAETRKWLMPQGWYAITKRFSAKEEKRRVVAYVVDPAKLPDRSYGFENHLNVIHANKAGINPDLARGIALFLNSTIVDQHFRTFSGHTQVNATDLRTMRFPAKSLLIQFGKWAAKQEKPTQAQIDHFIELHHGE